MSEPEGVWGQAGYRCRLEWGRRGARAAAERGDVLVVVDVLSFSSTVATAVHGGGVVYPCAEGEDPDALAARVGAERAVARRDVPGRGRFSLSPLTYLEIESGTRVVLPSPNGATCCRHAATVPHLFVGALLNARAVAGAVARVLLDAADLSVTVLACGERWQAASEDGGLRFAIEDYLGAGAILAGLPFPRSPEARVCAGAFREACGDLEAVLWECGSGRELRAKGCDGDVRHAARLDLYDSIPVMRAGRLECGAIRA